MKTYTSKITLEQAHEVIKKHLNKEEVINRAMMLIHSPSEVNDDKLTKELNEFEYTSLLNRGAYVVDSLCVAHHLLLKHDIPVPDISSIDYPSFVALNIDLLCYSGRLSESEIKGTRYNILNLSVYLELLNQISLPESIKLPNFMCDINLFSDNPKSNELLFEAGELVSKLQILSSTFSSILNGGSNHTVDRYALLKIRERAVYEDITTLFMQMIKSMGSDFYKITVTEPSRMIETTAEIWGLLIFLEE